MRHLLHVFPSFRVGGSQARFAVLANAFGAKYRHSIVALDGAFDCASRLGCDVPRILCAPDVGRFGLPSRLAALRARLRASSPALLLTYNWGAIEWALANRLRPICPHVHFEDGFGRDEADRQFKRRIVLRRIALSGDSRIVVPSHTLLDVARRIWRLADHRLLYIPNGVDCRRFGATRDPQLRERLTPDQSALLIGTVAALRPEKNIARLIRCAAPLFGRFDLRLVIVGDGVERAALGSLAAALGIGDRVIFAGAQPRPEEFLPHFDIFAISSDTEQMPLTVLEAMAAGLPVAGLDVGDVKQMVAPSAQRFIAPRSADSGLTDALATLLADPALRDEVGEANRRHVRAHYSLDAMLAAYDRLFSESG